MARFGTQYKGALRHTDSVTCPTALPFEGGAFQSVHSGAGLVLPRQHVCLCSDCAARAVQREPAPPPAVHLN